MLSIQFIAFQMLYKLFFGAQRIYQGQFKHIFVAEFDRWARLDPFYLHNADPVHS